MKLRVNWKRIGENRNLVGLFFGFAMAFVLFLLSGASHVQPNGTTSVFYDDPAFLETLERRSIDARFRLLRDGSNADTGIILIDISEDAVRTMAQDLGRWPWPRTIHGDVVQYLCLAETSPKSIVFDILFTESSRSEVGPQQTDPIIEKLYNIEDNLLGGKKMEVSREFGEVQVLLANLVNVQDYEFTNALRDRNVILAQGLHPGRSSTAQLLAEEYLRAEEERRIGIMSPFGRAFESPFAKKNFPVVSDATPPIEILTDNIIDLGHVTFTPDAGGPCRRYLPYIGYGDLYYPSLGVAAAQQSLGLPNAAIGVKKNRIQFGEQIRIPLNSDGTVNLNYKGRYQETYEVIDILEIFKSIQEYIANLRGEAEHELIYPPEYFSGKTVFIGTSAAGLLDLRATPFDPAVPGVFIHMTAADNIINNDFLKDLSRGAEGMILLVAALVTGLIAARLSPLKGAVVVIIGVVLYNALAMAAFQQGLLLPMVLPIMAVLLTYLSVVIYGYIKEEARRRWVQHAFGHYLSASVLKEILKDPDKLAFGGQRRNVTALFSDVAGFTSLSEKLPPEEVSLMLSEYLNHMVDCVYLTEGTLDKFIGDAVVAEWNTPLEQPDHPARACECALLMQEKIADLQRKWDAEGKPRLLVRIGIHSGDMVVGNLGSSQIFDYTAIGDNMNTAARLEPLNKDFGTRIMVSGITRDQTGDRFIFRDLGKVKLKGREAAEPLPISELIGRRGEVDIETVNLITAYHEALDHYYHRRWNQALDGFKRVLANRPNDGPAHAFIEIVAALKKRDEAGDLPADWSGYYEQKSK